MRPCRFATPARLPLAVAFLITAFHLSPANAQSTSVAPGVVIETVDSGSAPHRAGVRSGDVLIAWARLSSDAAAAPVRGRFRTPFDVRRFEMEEATKGAHVLTVQRAGRRLTLKNEPGPWTDMTSRPNFAGDALTEFERGLAQVGQTYGGRVVEEDLIHGRLLVNGLPVQKQDVEAGLRIWQQLASHLSGIGEHRAAAWLYWRISWERINQQKPQPEAPAALQEAEQALQDALTSLRPDECRDCEADLYARFAHELFRTNQLEPAKAAIARAREAAERTWPDSGMLAAVIQEAGLIGFGNAGDNGEARKAADALHREALALRAKVTPRSPERALLMAEYGMIHTGEGPESEQLVKDAWRLVVSSVPYSNEAVAVADTYSFIADLRGELALRERLLRHIARARERWMPHARPTTMALSQLADVLTIRGNLDQAEVMAQRSLDLANAIDQKFAAAGWPNRLIDAIHPLTALGDVAFARGDLAIAEDWYRQAIAVYQRRFKDRVAGDAVMGLGQVLEARGDIPRAFDLYSRAGRQLSNMTIGAVVKLARLVVAKGDLEAADGHVAPALAYVEQVMPGSIQHAEVVRALGLIATARGDFPAAAEHYKKATTILHNRAAGTVAESTGLQSLGEICRALNRPTDAEEALQKALAIRVRLASGTSLEAETRYTLALLHRDGGDPRTQSDFQLAISALERQVGRVGTTDQARAGTSGRQAHIYRDYVDWLVERGRNDEAFQMLERSRARSFLAGLAERDVRFSTDVPPALAEQRTRAEAEYDQLQAAIAAANPTREAEKVERLLTQLHVAQASLDIIADKIRAASPRAARIQYPRALSVAEAAAAIPADTVVLSYAVGMTRSFLFVLSPGQPTAVRVLPIAAGEDQLRSDVDAFRRLIQWKRAEAEADLLTRARALYDTLVRPAEAYIEPARHVLVVADGPLLSLPFSAVVRGPETTPQYFAQWKPLHNALSITAYTELRRQTRPSPSPKAVVVFADPSYPPVRGRAAGAVERDASETSDPTAEPSDKSPPDDTVRWDDWEAGQTDQVTLDVDVRTETERGARLTPLPGSRDEALALSRVFGRAATLYLGVDATEERATTVGSGARIVHFATHGLINDHLPLNSALALSIPTKSQSRSANGLLQAWEIYDRMRLDADLVTLSACETALGREARGDGLMGLTRAFLYAGARSVLASLWRVNDRSTATLMEQFYTGLAGGAPKDEALRAAQLALISSPATAHPYYWAAFQLHGGWK